MNLPFVGDRGFFVRVGSHRNAAPRQPAADPQRHFHRRVDAQSKAKWRGTPSAGALRLFVPCVVAHHLAADGAHKKHEVAEL